MSVEIRYRLLMMMNDTTNKFQYPLSNLLAATAGCALLFAPMRLGVDLGILQWLLLWDFGAMAGILAAFYTQKHRCVRTTILKASCGSACMTLAPILYFAIIDGFGVAFAQVCHEPAIFVLFLPLAIVGFFYGGLLGFVFFFACKKLRGSTEVLAENEP